MVAAQNTDLQRVWRLVQELSAQLKTNQQETERLRRFVELNPPDLASSRTTNGNGSVAHEKTTHAEEHVSLEEFNDLRHAYSLVLDENATLKDENEDLTQLCAEFEVGMSRSMEQVREHAFKVTMSTLDIHKSYATQLTVERQTNDALRSGAADLQGQLHRLGSLVREALREHSDVESESIIEALILENQALRARLEEVEEEGSPSSG